MSSVCRDSTNQITVNTENETCVASSEEFKDNIEELSVDFATGLLRQLKPVSFEYKNNPNAMHYGFIAEEVAGDHPELVINTAFRAPVFP